MESTKDSHEPYPTQNNSDKLYQAGKIGIIRHIK